ncbi:S-methyl-5-thioribose kinase [Sporosarcina siberiensis]|uniref:Methylthioribose kinase n=1 Tax=Sporosarcina siberiensis TaxID=1365606 RepID=A0ABW4SFS6_9BACL
MKRVVKVVGKKYEELNVEKAIQLAIDYQLFSEHSELSCTEIGDGNLNYVFRITDINTDESIIIKQALPYAKVVGESWPLTLKRAKIEAEALKEHGKYVPKIVPKVLGTDTSLAITILEDLSHLTVAREGLINGENYPKLAADIGEYLAKTLFYTSDFALHPFDKKKLVVQFSNPELCKITEDLVFTDPFFDSETNNIEPELQSIVEALWANKKTKLEVAKLKRTFLTKADALLHGDLHTGSIFVSQKETKVFDPEFAFYGPIGFDIGQFIANLIMQVLTREREQRELLTLQIEQTWLAFTTTFSELWKKDSVDNYSYIEDYEVEVLREVLSDTLGFAGCEIIRRVIGLAQVKDLESIQDSEKRIKIKKQALEIGELLILNRLKFGSIHSVTNLVRGAVE